MNNPGETIPVEGAVAVCNRNCDCVGECKAGLERPPVAVPVVDDGVARIAAERSRQKSVEGWTPEHDAEHTKGELATAAACYAAPELYKPGGDKFTGRPRADILHDWWPWDTEWWKPSPDNRIRELEKAGALIAAEIDRLLALSTATKVES